MIAKDTLLAMTETGATATATAAGRVTWSFASPTAATPPASTSSAATMDVVPGPMILVQRYEYTGRELGSESNEYYFRYRVYGPALGQFFTRDPIGYEAGMGLYGGGFAAAQGVDPLGAWSDPLRDPARDRAGVCADKDGDPYAALAAKVNLDPEEVKQWLQPFKENVQVKKGDKFTVPNVVLVTNGNFWNTNGVDPSVATEISDFIADITGTAIFNKWPKALGRGYRVKKVLSFTGEPKPSGSHGITKEALTAALLDADLAGWFHAGHGQGLTAGAGAGKLELANGVVGPGDLAVHHRLAFGVFWTCYAGWQNWSTLIYGPIRASKNRVGVDWITDYYDLPWMPPAHKP